MHAKYESLMWSTIFFSGTRGKSSGEVSQRKAVSALPMYNIVLIPEWRSTTSLWGSCGI
jgi:hypothetical protein